MILTEQQAIERLEQAITDAGCLTVLANRIGVSKALISDQRNGKRSITGAVAAYLKLKRIVHRSVHYMEAA